MVDLIGALVAIVILAWGARVLRRMDDGAAQRQREYEEEMRRRRHDERMKE